VTVSNLMGVHGQATVAADGLFTVADADGDTITKYAFWDREGNGHWNIDGVAQPAHTEIGVDAANLSQVSYTFGAKPDTLFIKAFDGMTWGEWTPFTATAGPNLAPTVTVSNLMGVHGQATVAADGLFTVADADGDTITKYAFWDREGNGHWNIDGVAQPAYTEIGVDAANLSQVSYTFGAKPDTLFIKAFDGMTWGEWTPFTATAGPNLAPTVTVSNLTGAHGQATVAADGLFTVADADGDTITKYAFWDREGNGHWSIDGVAQPAYTEIGVDAANLSQVSYTFGAKPDTLFIKAFDGMTWGEWTPFTATGNGLTVVQAGSSLELGADFNGTVLFADGPGTLKLDSSTTFTGTVAGMTGDDAIDFLDIDFATVQTPSFSGSSSGGTLTVTDGTHIANIALIGNYLASTFSASSDGHGGTFVVDPPANSNNLLMQPQHA
jgi:hypothetical protein